MCGDRRRRTAGHHANGEGVLGEGQAWKLLADSDVDDVCLRAAVEYSPEQGYVVRVFGFPMFADPRTGTLTASGPQTEFVLTKTAYFSRLSILHYLLNAQKLAPTGRLLRPTELKSGQIYLEGSHLLPLDAIAARFSTDAAAFLAQGARFNGRPVDYGDAAVELLPFPRVPITLIFWGEDEEFPARTYLLFDETCELQLPPDILWSVAMMCAMVMLRG
jgi:hypothetical protein